MLESTRWHSLLLNGHRLSFLEWPNGGKTNRSWICVFNSHAREKGGRGMFFACSLLQLQVSHPVWNADTEPEEPHAETTSVNAAVLSLDR